MRCTPNQSLRNSGTFSRWSMAPRPTSSSSTTEVRTQSSRREARGKAQSQVLQPLLEKAAEKFPQCNVHAYIDDITVTAKDVKDLVAFHHHIAEALSSAGVALNTKKCELYAPGHEGDVQKLVEGCAVVREQGIKILGAFISTSIEQQAEFVSSKMAKHEVLFSRLQKMAPAMGVGVLQKAALPRLGFYLRTHTPEATRAAAIAFDASVLGVLCTYANMSNLEEHSRMIAQLPQSLGGLGFLSQITRAEFAYAASVGTGDSESVCFSRCHTRTLATLRETPRLRNLLEMGARAGANVWLRQPLRLSVGDIATALQLRLCASPNSADSTCPGCGILLHGVDRTYHIPGCVRVKGYNASQLHDQVKHEVRRLANDVCIDCQEEPRDLEVDASGVKKRPDLRIWLSGTVAAHHTSSVVIDLSALNACASSYIGRTLSSIVAERTKEKRERYAALVESNASLTGEWKPREELLVFHFFPTGGLSTSSASLLRRLARAADDPDMSFADFQARVCQTILHGISALLRTARSDDDAI